MSKMMFVLIGAATLALSGTAMLSVADAKGDRASKSHDTRHHAMPSHRRAAAHERRGPVVKRTARAVPTAATVKKPPGSCGTYMYWKDGKCNDARAKK